MDIQLKLDSIWSTCTTVLEILLHPVRYLGCRPHNIEYMHNIYAHCVRLPLCTTSRGQTSTACSQGVSFNQKDGSRKMSMHFSYHIGTALWYSSFQNPLQTSDQVFSKPCPELEWSHMRSIYQQPLPQYHSMLQFWGLFWRSHMIQRSFMWLLVEPLLYGLHPPTVPSF